MALCYMCLALFCLPLQVSSTLYNPKVIPRNPPFYEGWYIRLQDPSNDFSMGIQFSSLFPETMPHRLTMPDTTSLVMALKSDGSGKLESYVTFPSILDAKITTTDGHRIIRNPTLISPADFIWNASDATDRRSFAVIRYQRRRYRPTVAVHTGYSESYRDETIVDFTVGNIHIKMQLGRPLPFRNDHTGPAGYLDNLPLPYHWFVYSLASPVVQYSWEDKSNNQLYQGNSGWAYQDNKWGKNLPDDWIWTQGTGEDASRTFVLGYRPENNTELTGHLFGYRNDEEDINISLTPFNSESSINIDGCLGLIDITMFWCDYRIRLTVSTSTGALSDCLYGPMTTGFSRKSVESYRSTATITVEKSWWFWWLTTDSYTFTGAALEFGGSYVCNHKCK